MEEIEVLGSWILKMEDRKPAIVIKIKNFDLKVGDEFLNYPDEGPPIKLKVDGIEMCSSLLLRGEAGLLLRPAFQLSIGDRLVKKDIKC